MPCSLTLNLIPFRQGLLMNVDLGWQSAGLSLFLTLVPIALVLYVQVWPHLAFTTGAGVGAQLVCVKQALLPTSHHLRTFFYDIFSANFSGLSI